jgi:hypothetical protein
MNMELKPGIGHLSLYQNDVNVGTTVEDLPHEFGNLGTVARYTPNNVIETGDSVVLEFFPSVNEMSLAAVTTDAVFVVRATYAQTISGTHVEFGSGSALGLPGIKPVDVTLTEAEPRSCRLDLGTVTAAVAQTLNRGLIGTDYFNVGADVTENSAKRVAAERVALQFTQAPATLDDLKQPEPDNLAPDVSDDETTAWVKNLLSDLHESLTSGDTDDETGESSAQSDNADGLDSLVEEILAAAEKGDLKLESDGRDGIGGAAGLNDADEPDPDAAEETDPSIEIVRFNLAIEEKTSDLREQITIRQDAGTLEYSQSAGDNEVFSRTHNADEVSDLLSNLSAFEYTVDTDAVEWWNKHVGGSNIAPAEYSLALDYADGSHRMLGGTYMRPSLPAQWPEILSAINELLQQGIYGEVFDPLRFLHGQRPDESIYVRVQFSEDGEPYDYLATDDVYDVDDKVVVPVVADNHESLATVLDVGYFKPGSEPFPPAKTKHVLRVATKADEEKLG